LIFYTFEFPHLLHWLISLSSEHSKFTLVENQLLIVYIGKVVLFPFLGNILNSNIFIALNKSNQILFNYLNKGQPNAVVKNQPKFDTSVYEAVQKNKKLP